MGSEFWNHFVGKIARKPKIVSQGGFDIGVGIVSQDGISVLYINLRREDAAAFARELMQVVARGVPVPATAFAFRMEEEPFRRN